ncbi:MAG: uracil-DNA glycosylase [Gemmatimonadota bacterium]|nr:uracil-DNA glycosylase [Gemmatimonadota bacterium]
MGFKPGLDGCSQAGAERLLSRQIAACDSCERLVDFRATFKSPENRRAHVDDYWAKPVPGFGDASGPLLVIGLAPGAHGANRTGRPFTGDSAGNVLYGALYRHGFSDRPESTHPDDGLELKGVYITNAVKCVPPANRPNGGEKRACLDWLRMEAERLRGTHVVLAMGRDAFEAYLRLLKAEGIIERVGRYRFMHGRTYRFDRDSRILVASYHFSRYNMNTGRLTEPMVEGLFETVNRLLADPDRNRGISVLSRT